MLCTSSFKNSVMQIYFMMCLSGIYLDRSRSVKQKNTESLQSIQTLQDQIDMYILAYIFFHQKKMRLGAELSSLNSVLDSQLCHSNFASVIFWTPTNLSALIIFLVKKWFFFFWRGSSCLLQRYVFKDRWINSICLNFPDSRVAHRLLHQF